MLRSASTTLCDIIALDIYAENSLSAMDVNRSSPETVLRDVLAQHASQLGTEGIAALSAHLLATVPEFNSPLTVSAFAAGLNAIREAVTQASISRDVSKEIADSFKAAWLLHDHGQALQALEAADVMETQFANSLTAEDRKELFTLRAWSHYRRGEWEQVLENVKCADGHQRALECEYYLRNYQPQYYDPQRVEELRRLIGSTINAANAFIIHARLVEPVEYDEVLAQMEKFSWPPPEGHTYKEFHFANLLHNTARVFLDKYRGPEDLNRAETLLQRALVHYGGGQTYLAARAAVNFWLADLYKKRGDFTAAAVAATRSETLWINQLRLETQQPNNFDKLLNARAMAVSLRELCGLSAAEIDRMASAAA